MTPPGPSRAKFNESEEAGANERWIGSRPLLPRGNMKEQGAASRSSGLTSGPQPLTPPAASGPGLIVCGTVRSSGRHGKFPKADRAWKHSVRDAMASCMRAFASQDQPVACGTRQRLKHISLAGLGFTSHVIADAAALHVILS
jgi:hypothetical protein